MPNDPTRTNTVTPLNSNIKLVDEKGNPTQFFTRWAQERSQDIAAGITYAQLLQVLGEIAIIAGVGLTGGGPINADVTLDLENTTVTPGPYTNANITVDAQGRITMAANGATGEIEVSDGTHDFTNIIKLLFSGAVVSNPATGEAEITIAAASALEVDDTAGPVATAVTNLKFTGADVLVTSPSAGHAVVDVTVPAFDLQVSDAIGIVASNVDLIEFTGADVTVTNPTPGKALIDVTVPSQIWAPLALGTLPGPDLVANADGTCIMVRIS